MRLTRITNRTVRLLATISILIAGWFGAVSTTLSAQNGSSDVAIFTTENGSAAYDACYVLVGYSDIGCDENGDGRVMFDAIPWGTYTVQQTADLGAGRSVNDFTINVRGNINSAGYESFSAIIVNSGGATSAGAGATGSSDIAIVTTENGQSVTDACYVIVDYSDVGCDENGDGKITFEDIPYGRWTVHQTADLGSGRSVPDFTIRVTGAASSDGWERFPATVQRTSGGATGSSAGGAAKDISLITRDPATGDLLTGTCYILVGYSEEGCDENGDGQVTFAAIPAGTYTVRQTATPAGYPTINDFPIFVDSSFPNVPVGFLAKQAREQNGSGTRNVSFVFVDSRTNTKVVPAQACLRIGTVSEVGCDEDLVDGQIDFLDVETGKHPLAFSNLPGGWSIGDEASVTISRRAGPQIVYLMVKTGSGSGASSSGGTSAGSGTSGSNGTSAGNRTWTASVQVSLCDADPKDGSPINCGGGAGITIDISLVTGELIGSCTTGDPVETPWGSVISLCSVDGMPFNADFVATQDPSTLPPGYVPANPTSTFSVGNINMGNGDGATFGFTNVRASSSSGSGSSTAAGCATANGMSCKVGGIVLSCFPAEACYGGTITATTEDGTVLGSCTMTDDVNDTSHPYSCGLTFTIAVERGSIVILTIDNVAPGYAAEMNPIRYDTTKSGGASHDTGFTLVPTDGTTTSSGDTTTAFELGTFETMVGTWAGKRRDMTVNANGTGTIDYREDAFGNGITYEITIDSTASPITATIVDAAPYGDLDASTYPGIGDTITMELRTYSDGNLLIVDMDPDEWELWLCAFDENGDLPNVQNACY